MKIAIIGGGIAGMSSAYYLNKFYPNAQIEIYERSSEIGGLAGAIVIGNTHIEKYYHHLFTHDKYYLELVKELGLEDKLIWKESKVGFYYKGVSYPFTTAIDLIKFKPLSFFNRIQVGLSSLLISKYKNVDKLETMTTEQFLTKYVGRQGWEIIWKPMLKIKFGDNYNKIPAVWIWERIVQRFRSRSGGGQKELLGYMKGSFHTLNQKLLETLESKKIKLHVNANVEEIVIENGVSKGLKVDGNFHEFDLVVCTAALPVFVNLIKEAPQAYIEPLKQIKYDCALVVMMTLEKKLSDLYWLNIADNEIPFGGLIEHTNFIPSEEYGGKTILYFSKYLSIDHPLLSAKNEDIIKQYVEQLLKIYPDFDPSSIESYVVSRDRYAQPIWPMKYSKFKPTYQTPISKLFLSNTSQIYPNDRGMNFSVKLGKEVAEAIKKAES
ncbi:NAD(P)/FAD-dependent oxidoreductase [Paenibacillus oryzisoli]|uniref:Amine oxidase domain-containing protein n=1 Tax=Paenibacillus oryzisoli TaxID=1850517 RepID=A0A198AG74_9BACL|nr:NAD(P)/FAD-dependent oxidoreductase [Paenibacillus oryzisoli]OAS20519.1 hypothetical protein A8708_18310 [Paenibacillus oryzisoli]